MTIHSNPKLTTCPDCGLTLPKNAPAGLCPACLLRAVMGPESETDCQLDDDPPLHSVAIESTSAFIEQGAAHRGNSITAVNLGELKTDDYPSPGTTLRYFGDYELYEEIARGGMGVVYRARQVRLNRRVALKMIRAGKFSSGTEIQRLRVEAEAAAQLDHPAIVPVFEVGEHEGLHYFTMAFVDGETLSAKLGAGPMPVRAAARLMQTVAEAVAYAHEKGVIHRDIKPGNILIDQSGQPRVSDFGLAKQVSSDNELTTTGQILGTPSYMPPEQALGKLEDVGRPSDIYSLGAVLYATLTGRPPFQAATSVETLRLVVEELPLAPRLLNPSIPRDLETICLKCLEKSISRRYESAKAVAEELERFLGGDPILAQPASRIRKLTRWYRRHWAIATTAISILLTITVVASVLAITTRRLKSELAKTANAEAAERRANDDAQDRLWISYLNEANAKHRSRQSGQRFGALRAIRKALEIPVPQGHSLDELRTEAIAAVCLPDLEVDQRIPHSANTGQFILDRDLRYFGFDDRESGKFLVKEIATGRECARLDCVSSSFDYHANTFSPDSQYFLYPRIVEGETHLSLWSIVDGTMVTDLGSKANIIDFRTDMQKLAVADLDGTIRFLDGSDFHEISRFASGLEAPEIAWHPRESQILAMSSECWKLFDFPSGKLLRECAVPQGMEGWPVWFPEDNRFVVGMQNAQIGIWDTQSGSLTVSPFSGHRAHGVIARISHDANVLASNDWSGILRLWDLRTGQQTLSIPAAGNKLQFSSDGKRLAADCRASEICIFRFTSGNELRTISSRPGTESTFSAGHCVPCVNPSGSLMAIAIPEGICVIDMHHDRIVCRISLPGNGPFRFHQSQNGESLWTYGSAGLLEWTIQDSADSQETTIGPPKLLAGLQAGNIWSSSLNGERLLIPWGNGARVWNRSTDEHFLLSGQTDVQTDVRTCAVTPDGKTGILGSHWYAENAVTVWNLDTREKLTNLDSRPGGVFISSDGQWLVTNGGRTQLWRIGDWDHPRTLSDYGTQICFARDSTMLALTDDLSRVRLVEPESGRDIAVLTVPQLTRLIPLFFTPDNGRLVTLGGETGALHIFDLREIREQLSSMGLDWDAPALPRASNSVAKFRTIRVIPANAEPKDSGTPESSDSE